MQTPARPTIDKKTLRREMAGLRDAIPEAERVALSQQLADTGSKQLAALRPLAGAVVAGYVAFRSELDPSWLMEALAKAGARLALPRMTGHDLALHAHEAGDPLRTGPFGILEPAPDAPLVTPSIILAPLLAFDTAGGRLGYGKGFYDRLFAAHPEALRVGVAFAVQKVGAVPREAHDARLHMVLAVG